MDILARGKMNVKINVAVVAGDSYILEEFVVYACINHGIHQWHVPVYSDGDLITSFDVFRDQDGQYGTVNKDINYVITINVTY